MSLANILATGNGVLEYRLKILGIAEEWVTHPSMEKTDGIITRRHGLLRKGLAISENIRLLDAQLNQGVFKATILDLQGHATSLFSSEPTAYCRLRSNATEAVTTFQVDSTVGFSTGSYFYIGQETVQIGSMTATSFGGCTRAQMGSLAMAHWVEDDTGTNAILQPYLTNVPTSFERRRIALYAYSDGDDFSGDGTLIYKGVILEEPKFDGETWSINIGGLSELLKSDLVGTSGEIRPRGFHIPDACKWSGVITEYDGPYSYSNPSLSASFSISGFFETAEDLCASLNSQLVTKTTSWSNRPLFEMRNGWLGIVFYPNASTPKFLIARVGHCPRMAGFGGAGEFLPEFLPQDSTLGLPGMPHLATPDGSWDPVFASDVIRTDGSSYFIPFGNSAWPTYIAPHYENPDYLTPGISSINHKILYLNVDDLPTEISRLSVRTSWPDFSTFNATSIATNPTDRWVWCEFSPPGNFVLLGYDDRRADEETGNQLSIQSVLAETGSVATLMETLTSRAPRYANLGKMPNITTWDWNNPESHVALSTSADSPFLYQRDYYQNGSIKFAELFQNECILASVFPATDATGSLVLRAFKFVTPTDTTVANVNSSNILNDNAFPRYTPNADGLVNIVSLKTGFDAVTGEYTGEPISVRFIDSIAVFGRSKELTISPRSRTTFPVDKRDVEARLTKIVRIWGRKYAVITFDVPFSLFNVLLGDTVTFEGNLIPSNGRLGTTLRGQCIHRSWNLDTGFGSLSILVFFGDFAGYSPSAMVLTGIDSGQPYLWTLTISSSLYSPPGKTESDFFQYGDRVDLYTIDPQAVSQSVSASGLIIGVTPGAGTTTLDVSFDSALPSGWITANGNFHLRFPISGSDPTMTAGQFDYCYVSLTASSGRKFVP